MPGAAESTRAGRTQYIGTLSFMASTGSGLSALEKCRTTFPDAESTISNVTGMEVDIVEFRK